MRRFKSQSQHRQNNGKKIITTSLITPTTCDNAHIKKRFNQYYLAVR